MAYPTVSGPYGLVPVNLLSGSPFVGVTRHFNIASGYSTAIFYGDAVKLVTGGTVERDTFDAAMTPVGVFLGCTYTPILTSVIRCSVSHIQPALSRLTLKHMLQMQLTFCSKLLLYLQVQQLVTLHRLTSVLTLQAWITLVIRLRATLVVRFLTLVLQLTLFLSVLSGWLRKLKTARVVLLRLTLSGTQVTSTTTRLAYKEI